MRIELEVSASVALCKIVLICKKLVSIGQHLPYIYMPPLYLYDIEHSFVFRKPTLTRIYI